MIRRAIPCPNFNHSRMNVPVRHCPSCGEVVNESIASEQCREEEHASQRRRRSTYCVDCGERLVMTR